MDNLNLKWANSKNALYVLNATIVNWKMFLNKAWYES